MPARPKRNYKKKYTRRKRRGKNLVSLNSEAFKKKVQKISKRLDDKTRVSNVNRLYWLGEYRQEDDQWTNFSYIDRTGTVMRLTVIKKSDVNQPIAVVVLNDILTVPYKGPTIPALSVPNPDDAGGNQAGATMGIVNKTTIGTRQSEFIFIKGFSMSGIITHSGYSNLNFPSNYDKIKMEWQLVSITNLDPEFLVNSKTYKPPFKELVKLNFAGYNKMCDIDYDINFNLQKTRILARGSATISLSDMLNIPKMKRFSRYVKFKKALKVVYHAADQTGEHVLKNPLYLCVWSNQLGTEGDNRAKCALSTSVYYYTD